MKMLDTFTSGQGLYYSIHPQLHLHKYGGVCVFTLFSIAITREVTNKLLHTEARISLLSCARVWLERANLEAHSLGQQGHWNAKRGH